MPPLFPSLPGQGWSVHKRPTFSTRVASHVSGREVRTALYALTLYEFELTFESLASASGYGGVGTGSLQTLLGFYNTCQGQLGSFLYVDPTDSAVHAQPLGIGDGTTTTFTLARTIGPILEAAPWVTQISAVSVGGVPQSAGWSLTMPNILTFTSPPAAGAAVTADFTYAFLCRFLDDAQDFENVMGGLWQLASLKFRSVRT